MSQDKKSRLTLSILFSMVLIGMACCQTETSREVRYIYEMDQKVDGNGFYNSYQSLDVKSLTLNNNAHGSGSLYTESTQNARNGTKYDEKSDLYTDINDRGIVLKESVDFSYAPTNMQIGNIPIKFQSKGAEQTCLLNNASSVSMNAAFSYADTLSKNLSAELYWKSVSSNDIFTSSESKEARTNLNFEAAFSGMGHVGAQDKPLKKGDSEILLDEDYRGTYYITKNLTHSYKFELTREADDWLPCCSGGFSDMTAADKKPFKSAAGIFDCTCFKVQDKAEFQRTE